MVLSSTACLEVTAVPNDARVECCRECTGGKFLSSIASQASRVSMPPTSRAGSLCCEPFFGFRDGSKHTNGSEVRLC